MVSQSKGLELKVLLTVKPQYADGFVEKCWPVSGQEVAVPPNVTLLITLELLSWKIVTDVPQVTRES